MSNTNETSNLVTLTDSELDAVSGGMLTLTAPKSLASACLELVTLGLTGCVGPVLGALNDAAQKG